MNKFATFFEVSKKFLSLLCFANDFYTLYNRLNTSRLAWFRNNMKNMWISKMQCWALFVISKGTFTKTAIKPKLVDRFSVGISIVSSLAQHQIPMQHVEIYHAWLPSINYLLLFYPILQHYHISEKFQRTTKCGKFLHAAWEFDVVLNSRQ